MPLVRHLLILALPLCVACALTKATVRMPNGDVLEVGAQAFLKGGVNHDFGVISLEEESQGTEGVIVPLAATSGPIRFSSDPRRGRRSGHRAQVVRPHSHNHNYGYRSRIIIENDTRDRRYRSGPAASPGRPDNPCFPHHCGDRITGPITNPNPRAETDKPTCYYDAAGVLFYEKPGSECAYIRRFNSHEVRVERRRQEYLRSQRRDASGR